MDLELLRRLPYGHAPMDGGRKERKEDLGLRHCGPQLCSNKRERDFCEKLARLRG